jgi:hypothetical protein
MHISRSCCSRLFVSRRSRGVAPFRTATPAIAARLCRGYNAPDSADTFQWLEEWKMIAS